MGAALVACSAARLSISMAAGTLVVTLSCPMRATSSPRMCRASSILSGGVLPGPANSLSKVFTASTGWLSSAYSHAMLNRMKV